MLLVDPGSAPITSRLREEIEALGLDVKLVPAREPAEPLEEQARAADAVGAIRLTGGGSGSVDMTILDRATGKTVSRHLAIAMPNDPASAELVATRTVELLRASLMELEAPHPARGDTPVTEEVRAIAVAESGSGAEAPRSESTLGVSTGSALVKSPALGLGFDVWFAFVLRGKNGLGGQASVLVPLVAEALDTPEGQIKAFAWQYRLGALFDGPEPTAWWSPRFGAGVALAMLTADGSARAPYVGASEHSTGWGPWASVGLRLQIVRQLSVIVAGDATFLVPEMVLRSAGHEVATFGRPLLSASAGLEVTR